MKAVWSPKSGSPDVLQYKEIKRPQPKPAEILVKVYYASVTSGDINLRKFNRAFLTVVGLLFGFKPMKIPGVEYAGVIEEVGSQVTSFSQGDLICGTTTGLSFGANAEYVCVPEKPQMGVITQKPANISFKDAACTPSLAANGKFVSVKSPTREKVEDFQFVLKLVESGEVKPVIDKEYPLEQITEAHRYVDSGRKKGNLAIKVYG